MANEQACPKCGEPLPPDVEPGHCPKCLMQVAFESEQDVLSGPETASSGKASAVWNLDDLATLFPELEIVEQVGTGGMGVVYKAKQKQLDRLVAVKLVRPDLCDDPAFAERFTREARAMARLSHPAIINVFDFGQRDNFYFFIMEFVDGANLRQLVRSGELDSKAALAVVPQICDALQYAHDAGIVHRDIKPENILLDKSGRVKIADFGLAKLVKPQPDDFTLTGTKQVVGTPHYMAPEQFEHPLEVDHRADIYSVGVVIYEMLTGELPLGRFALPSEKVQVDVRLDEIVLRALQKEPELRYQQVTEIKTGMESVSATPPGKRSEKVASEPASQGPEDRLQYPTYGLIASSIIDAGAFFVFLIMAMTLPWADDAFGLSALHIVGVFVYAGAREIQRRGSYRWAVGASVLAILPFHWGALIGIPSGIWSLILLCKSHTKSQFSETEDFAPEIEKVRRHSAAAFKRGSTALLAIQWNAIFSRVSPATGIRWARTTAGAGFRLIIWTIICLLTFSVAVLLVAQFGAWKVKVTDRSAYRVEGVSGRFDIGATGSVWQTGATYDPATLVRDEVSINLSPNVVEGRKAVQRNLIISVASMEYQTSSQLSATARPFDSDTILNWMKSMGVDSESAAVKQEAACLTEAVYEVSEDPSRGMTDDRKLAQLIGRDILTKGRHYSNFRLMVNVIPDIIPMAMACAVNLILWLTGIAIIVVNSFRTSESEIDHGKKTRLRLLVTTMGILTLWSLVAYLARPLVATYLPRGLASEFPKDFSANEASAAFISDLVVGVAWAVGIIVVSLPAWILGRRRGPRQLTEKSHSHDVLRDAEDVGPADMQQTDSRAHDQTLEHNDGT